MTVPGSVNTSHRSRLSIVKSLHEQKGLTGLLLESHVLTLPLLHDVNTGSLGKKLH